jgi:D-glycero-alpha-D-manno-heptose-7-phosphate kinase
VITTRTPLRLTFGGGGSDLTNGSGVCLAATINHSITITVAPAWDPVYILHYSQNEREVHVGGIQHRIIRRVFQHFGIQPGIQVSSIAEIPAGTGLGSSGAFTVGLLKALFPSASPLQLAMWASELDIGQQDQWSASFGGFNVYDFGLRTVQPIETALTAANFALYYTGMRHDSAQLLSGTTKSLPTALSQIDNMVDALAANDLPLVGALLEGQWGKKKMACPSREHQLVGGWIASGNLAGAHGGKLIGAGNGGFILFATEVDIDETMCRMGLRRIPFEFTWDGTRCV